ncbi:MAG: Double zinc ribbon [Chloroflexi bacterium ADurb.Bin360]|nr:MAG: Double zinc ribbon [Chloroflexi bacterium ADurb.Bin360]
MRCSNCGTENRVGARNCKQCGQPLLISAPSAPAAVPSPAPSPGLSVCPSCGMSLKPGTRFCTRCGTEVNATPFNPPPANVAPTLAPQPPQGMVPESPQPRLVQPPVPIPPPSVANSVAPVPSPMPVSPKKTGFRVSKGLVFAGIAVLLLCGTLAVLAALFKPWERLWPAPTPTPTLTPTATPEPTQTPTPTLTPAPTPTMTPTLESEAPEAPVQISLDSPPSSVAIGDKITLAVNITNTTGVTLTEVACQMQIEGLWYPYVEVAPLLGQRVDDIAPEAFGRCAFEITGKTSGEVRLKVLVFTLDHLDLKPSDEIVIKVE